jgi:Zn-dependent protease
MLTLFELADIVITIIAASFIFSGLTEHLKRHATFGQKLLLAAAIVGPAVVLHELGHKIFALAIGLQATFQAAYMWLGLGVLLKLIGFPLIFLVPAYVSVAGATPMQHAWIALAGPAINALLYVLCWLLLRFGTFNRTTTGVLIVSQTVNGFLFIFNMLPIPGFDGYAFWTGIF